MEELLHWLSIHAAVVIETIAVLIIAIGALEASIALARVVWQGATHGARKEVWHRFGVWLLLGLEFELAADVIRSVVSPTWQDLGQLATIAAIRTFLNYFLEKDLEHQAESAG